ncbi:MAG: exodeoxyribonuclease VII small subunit [Lachnospiraceae bacterium]|nr:exodeoxyribonuclease VII small subunit [Lachnospiraceae bacterium]
MAKKKSDSDENREIKIESVEEGLKILEETTEKLSEEDISLEDAFADFEKGMAVLKLVNEKIDKVEKKVKVITENGTEDFQ